ncbi:MAG: hypothetical protein HKM04_03470, partial [Legionellales bacterium]|nr:hypothetical protein [Legionellales bacterium]
PCPFACLFLTQNRLLPLVYHVSPAFCEICGVLRRLSKLFGTSVELWMNIQNQYATWEIIQHQDEINVEPLPASLRRAIDQSEQSR